jgi:hypothetical protein
MDSNEQAIRSEFIKMNKNVRKYFLLITRYIIEMQEKNKFNLLKNVQQYGQIFRDYPFIDFNVDEFNSLNALYFLYREYELFLEIKKYTKKTIKVEYLNSTLDKYLATVEEKNNFKRFLNAIAITNLIKKQLKHKSKQDILKYNLFHKLNYVYSDTVSRLNLCELNNLNTQEDIVNYMNNTYNYQNIFELINIDEDRYDEIYDIFYLFI